jgi:hypothetical protein
MDQQITCKKCGAQFITEAGNCEKQTLCSACRQLAGTFYPADLVNLIDEVPSIVSVCIVWNDRGSKSDQISNARKAFPELTKVPVGKLLQEFQGSSTYNLGTFILPVAIDLQEKGKTFGLVLSIQ